MPIEKEKTLASGLTGNYWRITSMIVDRQNLKVIAKIALFKDKTSSDLGKKPMPLEKTFTFPLDAEALFGAPDITAYIYGIIKAQAEVLITKDIMGNDLDPPVFTDRDIAEGIIVEGF